jgi:hypothetical protein
MGLDINTPKGQVTLLHERKMMDKINRIWVGREISFVETHKKFDSACDGFLVKMNTVIGIHESKCRNLTYEEIQKFGTWLVTAEKIEKCRAISEYLKVPFLGFLYLVPDDRILIWKITDENGNYLFDFKKERTQTQRTVNGGVANRINAFLPVKYAEELK